MRRITKLLTCIFLLMVVFENSILYSDSSNEYWRDFIADKQVWNLGTINKVVTHEDKVYVSGFFSQRYIDGVWFNGLSELKDSIWLPLGIDEKAGVRSSETMFTIINDMIIKDNSLYVVGMFDSAGSVKARNIARWDINNRTWDTLDIGTDGIIVSIAEINNKLVIGGNFDLLFCSNDTIVANNIAIWDGTTWNTLLGGVNGSINDLVVNNDNVYFVGDFDSVDNILARGFCIWNDSTNQWSSLGAFGPAGEILKIAKMDDTFFFGGYFDSVNTSTSIINAKNIVSWDGTSWQALNDGIDGHIHRLKVQDTNLFVVGSFEKSKNDSLFCRNILKWNHNEWAFLGTGTDEEVRDISFWGDSILVVGGFYFTGDTLALNIGLWNGEIAANLKQTTSNNYFDQDIVVKNYPNPANDKVEIEFYIENNSFVTVSVYDINGNFKNNLIEAFFRSGWNHITWNTVNFENGFYNIEVKSNESHAIGKIILNR